MMKKPEKICRTARGFLCLIIVIGFVTGVSAEKVTDIDGNVYETVQIGKQVWMTENLRVTRFNDGTEIPLITDPTLWARSTTPAYSWYNDDASERKVYGALYNWLAVETGKLCPPGWRIPSRADWDELEDFLAKLGLDAAALRTADYWEAPNEGASNSTGFSAVPGGYRYGEYWAPPTNITGPLYYEKGLNGYFWTSDPATETHAWSRTLSARTNKIYRSFFIKQSGFSVRAIKE